MSIKKIIQVLLPNDNRQKTSVSLDDTLQSLRQKIKLEELILFVRECGEEIDVQKEGQLKIGEILSSGLTIQTKKICKGNEYIIYLDKVQWQQIQVQSDETLDKLRKILNLQKENIFFSESSPIILEDEQDFSIQDIANGKDIFVQTNLENQEINKISIIDNINSFQQKADDNHLLLKQPFNMQNDVKYQQQNNNKIIKDIARNNDTELQMLYQVINKIILRRGSSNVPNQNFTNLLIDKEILQQVENEIKQNTDQSQQKISSKQNRQILIISEDEQNKRMVKNLISSCQPLDILQIIEQSQPFIFDLLKRKNRLDSFLRTLQRELGGLKISLLAGLSQLDLISLLSLSVSEISQPTLGYWLVRDSYPLPLFIKSPEESYFFQYRLAALCIENQNPLIVQVGTSSTKSTGKTKFLLSILGESKENLGFYRSKNKVGYLHDNSILLYCHLFKQFQLFDINYESTSSFSSLDHQFLKASLTAFCFSALKIIHVSLSKDFDDLGNPSHELADLLENYVIKGSICKKYNKFFIIYKDCEAYQTKEKERADQKIKDKYKIEFVTSFAITNMEELDDADFELEIRSLSTEFLSKLEEILVNSTGYDLSLIKQFYEEDASTFLMQRQNNYLKKYSSQYTEQKNAIIQSLTKQTNFKKLFPFQSADVEIFHEVGNLTQLEQALTRDYCKIMDSNIEIQLKQSKQNVERLKAEKRKIQYSNPIQEIFSFISKCKSSDISFIEIESSLVEWKLPILIPIKKQYGEYMFQLQDKENQTNAVLLNKIRKNIQELDSKIDNYDISFETVCQEVISNENQRSETDYTLEGINMSNRIVDQLLGAMPVNLIDGKTLQFGNSILQNAILSLDQKKKVYVISIIGAQSSAKSTLLNFLFGCGFQTSQGRCTKGMYITIMQYDDWYLLILDTEGLLSIQARDHKFDNQVCTMAFALSNLVLVNNKGEINTVLKNLLEVCIYALSALTEIKGKPKIIFCLRDQSSNDPEIQLQTLTNLMNSLNEAAEKVNVKINDLVDINQNDLFLLSSAFFNTVAMNQKEVCYLNKLFPQQVLKLRHYIISTFLNNSSSIKPYQNVAEFYKRGDEIWKIIVVKASSILELKSILESQLKSKLEQKSRDFALDQKQKLNEMLKCTYESNSKEEFEIIGSKFNNILDNYIEISKEKFDQIISDPQFGENTEFKEKAFELVKIKLKYYKTELHNYYRTIHSKEQSKCAVEQTQNDILQDIKKLIETNKTSKEEFEYQFKIISEQRQSIIRNKLLQTDVKKVVLVTIMHEKDNYFKGLPIKEKFIFEFSIPDIEFFFKSEEANIAFLSSKNNLFNQDWFIKKCKSSWLDNLLINSDSDYKTINREINLFIYTIKQQLNEIQQDQLIESEFDGIYQQMQNTIKQLSQNIKIKKDNIGPYLLKTGIYLLNLRLYEIEKYKITKYEIEIQQLIDCQQEKCLNLFNDKVDAHSTGIKAAIEIIQTLNENFIKNQKFYYKTEIGSEILIQFPDPEYLNIKAYEISFKERNFEQVVKYILDTDSLAVYLSNKLIQPKINNILNSRRQQMFDEHLNLFNSLSQIVSQWSLENFNFTSPVELLTLVEKFSKCSDLQTHFGSQQHVIQLIKVKDVQQFTAGFLKQVSNEQARINEVQKNILISIEQQINIDIQEQMVRAKGCQSRCPYCKNKCKLIANHGGQHNVTTHLVLGFAGWHMINSKIVMLNKCDNADMHQQNYQGDGKFYPFDEHIEKFNPLWRECIPKNGHSNQTKIEDIKEVIIGWEGTKSFFLKKYDLIDASNQNWQAFFNESKKNKLPDSYVLKN